MHSPTLNVIIIQVFFIYTVLCFTRYYRSTSIKDASADTVEKVTFAAKYLEIKSNDKVEKDSTVSCDSPEGLSLKRVPHNNDAQSLDCNDVCNASESRNYRLINYTIDSDLFVNGVRPTEEGLYCIRGDASVVRCNTATSDLLSGQRGEWHCAPRWPHVFGGPDGADILICGGSIWDEATGQVYEDRLPSSQRLPKLNDDPYLETTSVASNDGDKVKTYRWKCVPGRHRVDHMGNAYITSPSNRMKMIRNDCAKYIYRAVAQIAPSKGSVGYCDCLPGHGEMRVYGVKRESIEKDNSTKASDGGNTTAPHKGVVKLSHPCSPCNAGGGLDNDSYVVHIARPCLKSYENYSMNQKDITTETLMNRFPCGTNGFDKRSAACTSATVYVGVGLSEFGRKLIGRKRL